MPNVNDISYWGLFVSSFLSSTLLPGGSEIVLTLLAQQEKANIPALIIVASIGNTLGGLSSWVIGWWVNRRWPENTLREKHQRALNRLQRFGSPALLLSWLPVIGDPLCFIAGWLRINFLVATIFIAVGKTCRYLVLVYLVA